MAGKIDVALNDVIEKSKYKPPKPGGPKSKSKPPRKGFVGTSPAGTGMTNKFKGTKSGGGTIVKRPTLGGGGSSQPRPRPGVSARGGASSRFNQSGAFASRTLRPALGGGGRGGSRGGSAPREETLVVTRVINNQGGEDTRHKAGGVAKPRKAKAKAQRAAPYSKGNPDEQWGHDLYSANSSQDAERAESSPERTRSNSRRTIQTADNGGFLKRTLGEKAAKPKPKPAAGGTKVLISNLDYGVTTSDIKELFGSVGPLLRATVDTDGTGRSKGTASVVFVNEADAKSAIDEYNGAILDDKAIKMEFAPKIIRTVTSTASSSQGSFVVVQERGTSRKIVRRTTRGLASETF